MTDDYLSLVVNMAAEQYNIIALLSLLFLFLARMTPIVLMSPFFGAKILPHPTKIALILALFAIFFPKLLVVTETPLTFSLWLLFLLMKEMVIGLLIGTVISIPFFIAQNAGVIIDHQRGGASLMVNDPNVQNQSSPLGTLFNMMLIFVFWKIDGPFIFINAILRSYEILPPDKLLAAEFFAGDSPFWQINFGLFGKMMILSVQLAAPGLIMILMTDVFLGIANRLAPQVQITFLGMPLKSLLALLVVWMSWPFLIDQLVIESHSYLQMVNKLVHLLRPQGT